MATNWKKKCGELEKDLREMDQTAIKLRFDKEELRAKCNNLLQSQEQKVGQILTLKKYLDNESKLATKRQKDLDTKDDYIDALNKELVVLKARVSLLGAMSKAIIDEE